MPKITELSYVIETMREDLQKIGITAYVYAIHNQRPLIVFKSQEDLNWYKMAGQFREGDYIGGLYQNHIEFTYGWKDRILAILGIAPFKPSTRRPIRF